MNLRISNLSGFFDGYEYHKGPVSIHIVDGKVSNIVMGNDTNVEIFNGEGLIASVPFHDAHTHIIFGGERFFELKLKLEGKSYSEILESGGGIRHTMRESRGSSDEELKDLLISRLDVMMENGTLMVEAKTGYGLSVEEELRHLRILKEVDEIHPISVIPTFGGAHVPPPDYPRDQYILDIINEMLPIISRDKLAYSTDIFCDRGAFTVEETKMICQKSLDLGIPIRIHAEELEYTGIGKIASEEFKALSVDHLLNAHKDDFITFAKNGTVATFMPMAPISLFSNNIPQGWKNSGVEVALGSDFNPNNWIISMQTAIRMAVFRYGMTALQAFTAATTGSHKAILGVRKQSLRIGEEADMILLRGKSLEEICSKIGQNLVTHVIKQGKMLVKNNHKTS